MDSQGFLLNISNGTEIVVELANDEKDELLLLEGTFQHIEKARGEQFALNLTQPYQWDTPPPLGARAKTMLSYRGRGAHTLAEYIGQESPNTFLFKVKRVVAQEESRSFFRILVSVPITVHISNGRPPLEGNTIDISGGGLLTRFDKKIRLFYPVDMTLQLPKQNISLVADPVRIYQLPRKGYQIAFHYTEIAAKDRESIITFCFQEQRRQLRENVQAKNL